MYAEAVNQTAEIVPQNIICSGISIVPPAESALNRRSVSARLSPYSRSRRTRLSSFLAYVWASNSIRHGSWGHGQSPISHRVLTARSS